MRITPGQQPTSVSRRVLAGLAVLVIAGAAVIATYAQQPPAEQASSGPRPTLVEPVNRPEGLALGHLQGGPIFDDARPKPEAPGDAEDPETLLTPPPGFTIQRRNNFYREDGFDGLYRWASSGHWSNYDEVLTGDWKSTVPDVMTMLNGEKVTTAEQWREVRRPEIIALLEDAIFGRIPDNVPNVVWTKTGETDNGDGTITVTATGALVNADGTPYEAPGRAGGRGPGAGVGDVDDYYVYAFQEPAAAAQPDPAAPAAGRAGRGRGQGRAGGRGAGGPGGFGGGRGGAGGGLSVSYTIPATASAEHPVGLIRSGGQQALGMGLGTVTFGGQAPNVRSNPPLPTDWGAIRRSVWPISRGIDFLETDPRVNAHQIAVTGHSINGKQALAAGVFEERVGLVFASCSGEGGASMMRRDWGETIDDLAQLSPQNYCDNFQKWVRNWSKMPVDAHFLVAAMAPRPVLVSGGSTDQWSDPVGVFWAAYFASPAYEILGEKGVGISEPPEMNTFVGEKLVFYHHIGGHITTGEETAKYYEMARTYFDTAKPAETGGAQ